jgi:NADPH:quinone reductase-like Zn-dependent oxidoreductase
MAPPSKNKQWISAQDGIENLKQTESEMPVPGDDEVLVQINTIALNYRDTEVVMGLYNRK